MEKMRSLKTFQEDKFELHLNGKLTLKKCCLLSPRSISGLKEITLQNTLLLVSELQDDCTPPPSLIEMTSSSQTFGFKS